MTDLNAEVLLESNFSEAEEMIKDPDALEGFLRRLEEKLKTVPLAGDALSNVPVLISMVRSYANKEYPEIPLGTIVAIISALIYFLSPIDLIPDEIPVIGYADDAAVVLACLSMVQSDFDKYKAWRDARFTC